MNNIISIVTTCKNSASTIRDTIESILTQQGDFEIEYIVTDAGSTDGTLEILSSYGNRLKIIPAVGLNQSQGINLGIRNATGDILAFLNADDVYKPGALAKVYTAFCSHPDTRWLVGRCDIIDERGQLMNSWITSYKNALLKRYSYFLLLSENFICQPAVFFSRRAVQEFGEFREDENLVMDYEYWLRLGMQHPPLILSDELASFRRMRTTKSNSLFYRQFRDDLRVGVKYAMRNHSYLAIPLKFMNYIKTISIYSFLYRSSANSAR